MKQLILIVLPFLLVGTAIAQDLPEVNGIMNSALQKVLGDEKLKTECLTFYKKYTDQKIEEKQGKIVPTDIKEQELYYVFSKNGVSFEELVEKNGRPPSAEDRKEKMADKRPDIKDILGRNRYNYQLLGINEYLGRTVYSISFEPKHPSLQPKAPDKSLKKVAENAILNNLYGLIYVDSDNFIILRVETHILRPPLRIKTGKLFRFDTTFERGMIGNISVNTKLTIIIKYSYVSFVWNLFEKFQRITVDYENYKSGCSN